MSRLHLLCLLGVSALAYGLWPASSRGDLLLHWTFDEVPSGDQNTMNLGTAAGANGIFNGGATRTTDTPGGASHAAADLLAVGNGHVSAAQSGDLDGLEQITLTAWINLQGDPPADGSVNDRIASLQDGTAAFNGFSFNVNAPAVGEYTADNFRLGMFVGGTDGFASGFSEDIFFHAGEWIFVATTYDGLSTADNLVFYFGTEDEEVVEHFFPLTAAGGPVAPVAAGTGFHLGRTDAAPSANTSLEGFIDDVRIYNEILGLEELEAIRLEGLTEPPPVGDTPGDYNNNGLVEQEDLDLVLANWGEPASSAPATWVNDPPDGNIDQTELDRVLVNWGISRGVGAAVAVPEPHALAIGALAVLAALCFVRTRHGRSR